MTHSRDPQHEQATSHAAIAQTESQASAAWPGGWYVYEDGRVEGPFSAEDAFRLEAETSEGKPRLVSRKGFTQWYALRDLSEIFKMTEQMGRKARDVATFSEAQLAGEVAKAAVQQPAAISVQPKRINLEPKQDPARRSTPVSILAAPHAVEPFTTADMMRSALPDAAVKHSDAKTVEAGGVKNAADLAYPSVAPSSILPRSNRDVAKGRRRAPKVTAKAALMQEYFLARGRLRLGKMRNPWITAFVGLPLTFGMFWAVWMRDISREVAFHAGNSNRTTVLPTWLALVPIVHMVMTYKLAKLIVEMEAQNRYRSVSPLVAVLFSLFPPFALAYLQDAANRHWLLHVRHVAAKRRGSPA